MSLANPWNNYLSEFFYTFLVQKLRRTCLDFSTRSWYKNYVEIFQIFYAFLAQKLRRKRALFDSFDSIPRLVPRRDSTRSTQQAPWQSSAITTESLSPGQCAEFMFTGYCTSAISKKDRALKITLFAFAATTNERQAGCLGKTNLF